VILYHFTSGVHLAEIEKTGYVKTGDNMLRAFGGGPPECSFHFDVPEVPRGYGGLTGSVFDKTEVRLTFDVVDSWAVRWIDWACAQGIAPMWLDALAHAAGGIHHYEHEYAVFRRIPLDRCVDIRRRD
jgi:hypothetical protein